MQPLPQPTLRQPCRELPVNLASSKTLTSVTAFRARQVQLGVNESRRTVVVLTYRIQTACNPHVISPPRLKPHSGMYHYLFCLGY